MTAIILQITAALVLAFGVGRSCHRLLRDRKKTFTAIIERMSYANGRLGSLSYGMFSEDIACSEEEVWERIAGSRGLWEMFRNTEVLLEIVVYLQTFQVMSPACQQRLETLHGSGKRLRLAVLLCSVRTFIFNPNSQTDRSVIEAARAYMTLTSHLALVISDYYPDLLMRYRFHLSRS